MPFTKDDAKKYNTKLTDKQAEHWAKIANGYYNRCMLRKGATDDECTGEAVRSANAFFAEKTDAKIDTSLPGVVPILTVDGNDEGRVLHIETARMPGQGGVQITGNVGWDMSQSARAALSYVKSRAKALNIKADFTKEDVHLHAPHMAWSKDGASAGVAIATALVSLFTNRPVRQGVAMTGEVSLTGSVLPVAGINGKLTAAWEARFTDVILPVENAEDLNKVSDEVLRGINVHFAETMDDVLPIAFGGVGAAMLMAIKKEEKNMDLKVLAEALGLKDATEEKILKALGDMAGELETLKKEGERAGVILKALGLGDDATTEDVVGAIEALQGEAETKGLVSADTFKAAQTKIGELEEKVKTLRAESDDREFAAFMKENAHKITPAQRETSKELWAKDRENFKKNVEAQAPIIPKDRVKLAKDGGYDPSLKGKNVDPEVEERHLRALQIEKEEKIPYKQALVKAASAGQ